MEYIYFLGPYTPQLTKDIPQFYWNNKSQEQRYFFLCRLLNHIGNYLNSVTDQVNENANELLRLIEEFKKFQESGFTDYYEKQIKEWIDANMEAIISRAIKMVFFGLTDDGYFCAYIPKSWAGIAFDTGAVYDSTTYGRLILRY